ncbi:MAG: type II toxin-antitoxin system PemK/MazF family toxin [Symploca sp. SIO1A3]|nr:type II toxin-antitoxin system PemK/MazF family toxin [Symploca sp. SIO1A3]
MPNGHLTYKRGEIWWIDLHPVVGHETDKKRPCLIMQNDIGNQNGATTIVAPLLPGTRTYSALLCYEVQHQSSRFRDSGLILYSIRAQSAVSICCECYTDC